MAELLVEVGFEEMPARWLEPLAIDFADKLTQAADRERLAPREAQALWTPRRLVLRADLAVRQPDREETIWGPALQVARDAAGKWTKAAEGFAKKNGVTTVELGQGPKDAAKPGELYLSFVRKVAGRAASEVLPSVLMGVLRALAFPKRMSWDAWLDDGRGSFPFGRPIRWLIVLLDSEVVPLRIHGLVEGAKGPIIVESADATRGHRFLPAGGGGRRVAVRSFAELEKALADNFVVVDPSERATTIREGLGRLASPGTAVLPDRHGLVQEWRDLVEFPTVVLGRVPSEFHTLPTEVLETVLVHHQKYIPLPDATGRIARFAAVINGNGSAAGEIVPGMERVVVARLRDGAFFYAEDRKRPLADRLEDLAGVTFQQGLGTYREKTARMVRLVQAMSGWLEASELATAAEAAGLAKCDLTTLMVREFPELQGTVGRIYLRNDGANAAVASAVGRHYEPDAAEPEHLRATAAVSLADKLDTVAGYFGLGESPTGSRDPYGLRRAGQGIVRAVLDFWNASPPAPEQRPDLLALARAAAEGYGTLKLPVTDLATSVSTFLLERLEYVLETRGLARDEVAAAVDAPYPDERPPALAEALPGMRALADPIDALARAQALQHVRRERPQDFAALAEAFKRAKNILAQAAPAASVDPKLFEGEAEKLLFEAASRLERPEGSYEERLRALADLQAPVGRFFDDVLVMAGGALQGNRLALLRLTLSLFYRIADISKLGGNS